MKKSDTPLYKVWKSTKHRAEASSIFSLYPPWKSFDNFKIWADQTGYQEGDYLIRINKDLNWHPMNCRWTNPAEERKIKRGLSEGGKKGSLVHIEK